MPVKPRPGWMARSPLTPSAIPGLLKFESKTMAPVFLPTYRNRFSIRSSASENRTALAWASPSSARSFRITLGPSPSKALQNRAPSSSSVSRSLLKSILNRLHPHFHKSLLSAPRLLLVHILDRLLTSRGLTAQHCHSKVHRTAAEQFRWRFFCLL